MPRDRERNIVAYGAIWQTQYSLIPLLELETDVAVKAAYLEAMRLNARIMKATKPRPDGQALEVMVMAFNRRTVAPVKTASRQRRRRELRALCEEYIRRHPRSRTSLAVYWTAVKQGVLDGPPAQR